MLMLGWEYPPRFAGGLGKACRGLSQAMARQGAQVFFVLPTFPERISEPRLEVVGAREALIRAGWSEEHYERLERTHMSGVQTIRSDARLFPYGAAPEGPTSRMIDQVFDRVEKGVKLKPFEGIVSGSPAQSANVGSAPAPSASEIYGKNMWSEIERFCFSVRQIAETHEVDCVHAHDWMTFPAAFEFQKMTGVPVFLHVHATEYDRAGEYVNSEVFRIERDGFRKADHIFAVSRYTAGVIERLYGINKRKISVVYNAPEDEAKRMTASPEASREPDVIFLGRLTFQKGPDHFLKACALVAEADSKARFVFCGTGDMLNQLRQLAFKLGIEGRVHFAGFIDPPGVDQILQRSKVLVMPSVSEPFGLVALEAIHCGIPVILSKQSGVREVLHRALQVDFWDIEKLADQILAALRLPDLSKQLVAEGMEQVRALSWDRSAENVIETYRWVMGSTMTQAVKGAHGH